VKILFDQCTPVPLRKALIGHQVETAFELAWGELNNGELLATAEAAGVRFARNHRPEPPLSARSQANDDRYNRFAFNVLAQNSAQY
jgi:hypothetical protein